MKKIVIFFKREIKSSILNYPSGGGLYMPSFINVGETEEILIFVIYSETDARGETGHKPCHYYCNGSTFILQLLSTK